MKFLLKLPGGVKLRFQQKPMDPDKFRAVCRLAGFWLYVKLAKVVASTDDFFALLYFYALTAALAGAWLWIDYNRG